MSDWWTDDAREADEIVGPVEWEGAVPVARSLSMVLCRHRLAYYPEGNEQVHPGWYREIWSASQKRWCIIFGYSPHEALALRENHYREWLSKKGKDVVAAGAEWVIRHSESGVYIYAFDTYHEAQIAAVLAIEAEKEDSSDKAKEAAI